MHELSLAQAMIERLTSLAAQEGAQRVLTVRVVVGALSGVEPEALAFAFPVAAEGTVAEGARVEILPQALGLRCEDCGAQSEREDPYPLCPHCGSTRVTVTAGRDFLLHSVEVE